MSIRSRRPALTLIAILILSEPQKVDRDWRHQHFREDVICPLTLQSVPWRLTSATQPTGLLFSGAAGQRGPTWLSRRRVTLSCKYANMSHRYPSSSPPEHEVWIDMWPARA